MPPKTKHEYELVIYDLYGNCFRKLWEAMLDFGKAAKEAIYSIVDTVGAIELSLRMNPILATAKMEKIMLAERWSDRLRMKRRGRNKCRMI